MPACSYHPTDALILRKPKRHYRVGLRVEYVLVPGAVSPVFWSNPSVLDTGNCAPKSASPRRDTSTTPAVTRTTRSIDSTLHPTRAKRSRSSPLRRDVWWPSTVGYAPVVRMASLCLYRWTTKAQRATWAATTLKGTYSRDTADLLLIAVPPTKITGLTLSTTMSVPAHPTTDYA